MWCWDFYLMIGFTFAQMSYRLLVKGRRWRKKKKKEKERHTKTYRDQKKKKKKKKNGAKTEEPSNGWLNMLSIP
jgi:hypothetical protein